MLQISAQVGFSLDYTRRLENLGTLTTSFGYTFEYIANDSTGPLSGPVAGNTSIKHYLSLSVGLGL